VGAVAAGGDRGGRSTTACRGKDGLVHSGNRSAHDVGPRRIWVGCGSVAAKFEVTAYSKLAPPKISNLCIFEYTYVYSNIHGHFVDDYRIWTPFDSRPVNSKLWVSANP
jgi:hypothetical protein